MTQEDKELILKDLCARLPYGVKVTNGIQIITLKVRIDTAPATLAQFIQSENLRYYLRPMSSMTEEEREEMLKLHVDDRLSGQIEICDANCIDFYNSHHFDYRGLIEKGLALEAPEGMYNFK